MKYGVIVAEDEMLIQKDLIRKINESSTDFEVVGSSQTGVQALELIKKEAPSLLVTDIRMPVMDGLELIRQAREILPDMDTIIISGYSEFEYAQTAIHLQVREYLLKPVDKKKLEDALLSLQREYAIKIQDLEKFFSSSASRTPFQTTEVLKDYLTENFSKQINLNLIAENLNYSPTHLSRLFQQYYKISPSKYLIKIRMERAKQYMDTQPDMTVHMVGEAVGYPDPGYFSRIFKKYVGVSPQKYREMSEEA